MQLQPSFGRRFTHILLVLCLLCTWCVKTAPAASDEKPTSADEDKADIRDIPETRGVKDFVDKWVISGNAMGNAAGAVAGQALFTAIFGPAGWVVGSMIGSLLGGMVGELIDNKVHKAYNYAAFNRPPLGEGGLVLRNVGPYEQLFYQIDARGIILGNVFTLMSHFGLNIAARSIPGMGWLMHPGLLLVSDYFSGIIGDNIDGLVDMASVGAEIDSYREEQESQEATGATTAPGKRLSLRELFEAAKRAMIKQRTDETVDDEAQRALDAYSQAYEQFLRSAAEEAEHPAPAAASPSQ